MWTNDINSAELIVRCRRQLALIEECSAKGIDERAAYEIAAFAGLAQQLRWAAEDEYAEFHYDNLQRGLERRKQMAEAA